MNVYVAGTWNHRLFVKEIMVLLTSNGHNVTTDWTRHCKAEDAAMYALEDMNGVKSCDVFVLVDPNTVSRGKFTEFGMALALNKKIIVLCDIEQDPATCLGVFGHIRQSYSAASSFEGVVNIIKDMEGK